MKSFNNKSTQTEWLVVFGTFRRGGGISWNPNQIKGRDFSGIPLLKSSVISVGWQDSWPQEHRVLIVSALRLSKKLRMAPGLDQPHPEKVALVTSSGLSMCMTDWWSLLLSNHDSYSQLPNNELAKVLDFRGIKIKYWVMTFYHHYQFQICSKPTFNVIELNRRSSNKNIRMSFFYLSLKRFP